MNDQNRELIHFENKRSFIGMFNGRRPDKLLKFNAELAHFEAQVMSSPDKELIKCTQESFQVALLESATLGLSWNKRMGHCYPIRYGNTCTLSVGYQGLTHLVTKAGTLKSIQPEVVCENDPVFESSVDEHGVHIKHQMARTNRGRITHAYCIAHYINGGYHVEIMGIDSLNKCQEAAKTQFVWKQWYDQMCMKSVIRRAWKHWPKDDGGVIEAAIDIMDKSEPMDFSNTTPVDVEPQYIVVSEEQCLTLHTTLNDFFVEMKRDGPSKLASKQLRLLAEAMGFRKIEDLPADQYDSAVAKIEKWMAAVEENQKEKGNE